MKLYRTRTQEEYDWLMQKLEDEGCKWIGGDKPTNNKDARAYANEVVVYLDSDKILTWNFVRDVESKRLKNIIEVSDLMKQHPLATKVEERNNKPKPYTPPNTGDPWIDNLPESYFEMYEDEEMLKELTEPLDLIEQHKRICERLNKVYADKNHDYGNSFGETYEKYGDISALVRISDKMNRIERLVQTGKQKVKDEALEDSILDMANYLIMWAMELEEEE